jgi:hypothetical protein
MSQTNWEADKMRVLFAFSPAYCPVFSFVVSLYLGFCILVSLFLSVNGFFVLFSI